jgi:hypothetical protein
MIHKDKLSAAVESFFFVNQLKIEAEYFFNLSVVLKNSLKTWQ